MSSPNINRKPEPMRIGGRNVILADNPSLRSVIAAFKVRQIIARDKAAK